MGSNTLCSCIVAFISLKNENTLKNEQRSRDAAAKKELIQVEYIGKNNNNYEDIYISTPLLQHPLTTPIHSNHTHFPRSCFCYFCAINNKRCSKNIRDRSKYN